MCSTNSEPDLGTDAGTDLGTGLPSGGPTVVELPAADGHPLQALLHRPADLTAARAALLWVHGKGGNCYTGPVRRLPPLVDPERFVHLAVNLRCHDLAYSMLGDSAGIATDPGTVAGGMWERLADGPLDIGGAVTWLRERTGLPVYVLAHSAGGYFLGDWSADDPVVAGRVFLSPLTSVRFALSAWFPDEASLAAARESAEKLVAAGRGHQLIVVPAWYFAISANSLLERLGERPNRWLDGCNASTAPVLLAWGGAETRAALWHELHDKVTAADRSWLELPGAGHEYLGQERDLADAITGFVDRTLAAASALENRP